MSLVHARVARVGDEDRRGTRQLQRFFAGKKVVPIDGFMLAGLMIDYNVGVSMTKRYKLKEVSKDFIKGAEV